MYKILDLLMNKHNLKVKISILINTTKKWLNLV